MQIGNDKTRQIIDPSEQDGAEGQHDTQEGRSERNFVLALSKAEEILRSSSSLEVGGADLKAPGLSFDFKNFKERLEALLESRSTENSLLTDASFSFLAGSVIERLPDKPIAVDVLRALSRLDPETALRLVDVTNWGHRYDEDESPGQRILPLLKGIKEEWSTAKLESLVHEWAEARVARGALMELKARDLDRAVQALQVAWPVLTPDAQDIARMQVFGYDQPIPESFKPLSEEERREFFQKTTSLPLNLLNSETSLGGLLQSGGSSESYQELFRAAALAGSLFSVQRYRDFTLPPDESFDLSVFRSAVKLSEEITRKYKADLQNLEPFFNQAELYTREPEPV